MNICILSDSPALPTGYRNQAVQLVQYLEKKGHKVHYLANAFVGTTLDGIKLEDGTELKAKIHGSMFGQDYFANTMSQIFKDNQIDRFIILLDTFMIFPWFLNIDTSPAKTYFWVPSDGGGGLPSGCENILKKVDCPVSMSKFAQKQIKDYHGIDTKYIPLGIDTKRFFRLKDEERNILRNKWGLKDKFVIGVVARNQPRKNLDRTLKIMYLLKDRLPNAVLLLHMDPNDPAQQMFNFNKLIQRYNLENRIIFTGMKAYKGFAWDKMNELYNLMDVFLLTTSGEGFGIPIVEAMATETPVLATGYTTTDELITETGAGLPINLSGQPNYTNLLTLNSQEYDKICLDSTITGSWEVERGCCSIYDAVNKLVWLNDHQTECKIMGLNGRKNAVEFYDFEKIGSAWEELLCEQS